MSEFVCNDVGSFRSTPSRQRRADHLPPRRRNQKKIGKRAVLKPKPLASWFGEQCALSPHLFIAPNIAYDKLEKGSVEAQTTRTRLGLVCSVPFPPI